MHAKIGDQLPAFTRTTDFANWNRYAAVNDEFIDVHMSEEAARLRASPTSSAWATSVSPTPRDVARWLRLALVTGRGRGDIASSPASSASSTSGATI